MKEYSNFAFVSYSHKDEKWAAWIQEKLEAYRLPSVIRKEAGSTVPERIAPVFRDATDLAAGRLRNNLQEELEASKFLIVVCSPNSAKPNAEGKHWVNDEVAHFAAMGREDRILPVIVGGTSEKNAFCPKLAELGLLAIDATKKSRTRTLNDIVAFLLGLRPDELWNREERIRKAKRRVAMGLATVGAIMLAAAVCCWYDMCGLHVEHYADYVDHWGIPVGIPSTRLNARQVANRTMSFRFEYRGRERFLSGKRILRRVVKVNSLDIPVVVDDDYSIVDFYFGERPVIQTFHYKEDKTADEFWQKLDFVDDQDRNGKNLVRHKFSGARMTDVEHVRPLESGEADSHALAESTSSNAGIGTFGLANNDSTHCDIRRYKLKRNKLGIAEKVEFYKDRSLRTKDADGIYGYSYKLDSDGRVRGLTYLGYTGEPHPNKLGIAGKKRQFDSHGNLSAVSYVDKYGRSVLNVRDGVATFRYEHDEFGNFVKLECLAAAGAVVRSKEGAAIRRNSIVNGKVVRTEALDEEGRPVMLTQGWSAIELSYARSGDIGELWFLGKNGEKTFVVDGYAGVRRQFVDHEETRRVYLGTDGSPTMCKKGYAEERGEYDDHRLVLVSYFDVNGDPATSSEIGAHGMKWEYDSDGMTVSRAAVGADGELVMGPNGVAEEKYEYVDGLQVKVRYLDCQGHLCENGYGIAGWDSEFENGNVVRRTNIGASGAPVLNVEGYAGEHVKYENGLVTAYRIVDLDGNAVANKNGVAGYNASYDEAGRRVRFEYVGANESSVLSPTEGTAGYRSFYDVNGNEVKREHLGADGNPCLHNDGNAGWVAAYNDMGLVTSFGHVGLDGKPTLSLVTGVATEKYEYDAFGNRIKESYFAPDGTPYLNKQQGAASRTFSYDALGRVTEQMLYGVDGRPVVFPGLNAAGERTAYDVFGHVCMVTFIGTNGVPIVSGKGFASEKSVYDSRGNLVEQYWLGADGELLAQPEAGVAGFKSSFDQLGREIEKIWIGADGRPCRHRDGNAGWRAKYDAWGRMLEMVHLDESGNLLANNKNGTAGERRKYDRKGNVIECEFVGTDGNAVRSFDGYAREIIEYDDFGNQTRKSYYDERGQAVLLPGKGFASESWMRGRGEGDLSELNFVEHAFYGLRGEPVHDEQGLFVVRSYYNPVQKEVRREYLMPDGRPAVDGRGMSSIDFLYDERGLLVKTRVYGLGEIPLAADDRNCHGTDTAYDDFGNEVEERCIGVDGQLTYCADGYAFWRALYDADGHEVQRVFFDLNQAPTDSFAGYSAECKGYDANGNWIYQAFCDSNGKRCFSKEGYSGMEVECNVFGKVTWCQLVGTNDCFVSSKGGRFLSCRSLFDLNQNETNKVFVGRNGEPTLDSLGTYGSRADYDPRNRVTRVRYLDAKGEPEQISVEGRAGYTQDWNDIGKLLRETSIDLSGSPTNGTLGYASIAYEYDIYGREVERKYLDALGCLACDVSGWYSDLDAYGYCTNRWWFGRDGKPCLAADGTAGLRAVFSNGLEIVRTSFGLDGSPCLTADGCSIVVRVYDERRREVSCRYCDETGRPVVLKSGESECRHEYDERGLISRVSYLGADGLPVETGVGQSVTYRYDSCGNEVERAFWGAKGQPYADTNGVAKIVFSYDARHRQVRESYWGADGKPVIRTDLGYASLSKGYDEMGNLSEVQYWNASGKLATNFCGVAIERYAHDEMGRVVGVGYFNAAGNPTCELTSGIAGHDSAYDAVGNEVKRVYVGTDGRPIRHVEGYCAYRATYDERRRLTRINYLDDASQPCVSTNGVAGYRYEHGAFDRLVQIECLGTDGKPTVCNDGYAVRKLTYDRYGRIASERNYDIAVKPCALHSTGCFGWNAEYDRLGKETLRTWIGVDGKPSASKKTGGKKGE